MKESVPIITGNFRPFRLVLRPKDIWNPTLEQINSRSYDYVKLHRMSAYFDVGIAPYSLGICFDGTLVLPAVKRFHDIASAVSQFNKTLSELLVGGIYCEAVSPDDIGSGSLSFTAYSRISSGAMGSVASLNVAARTKHIGTLDVIKLLEPEVVSTDALQTALSEGRKLLNSLGDISREQLLYGATFYVRKQWAESLIHIWTTIERIIEIAWQTHVIDSGPPTSKKRRSFLDDYRTWTSAAKLEVLFQKGILPTDTYDKLDESRKARNALAHKSHVPSYEAARTALQGCFEFASLCSSNFSDRDLFDAVNRLINDRCNPELLPRKRIFKPAEVSHWLDLPALPGDEKWGNKEYEILEDLMLKPVKRDKA